MSKAIIAAVALAGAAMLAACSEESAKRVRAEDAVKEQLKDPASAKFEGVRKGKTDQHICGLVNAKNSFGAYLGSTPFVYTEFSPQNSFVIIQDRPQDKDFIMLKHDFKNYDLHQSIEHKCRSIDHMNLGCNATLEPPHPICKHVLSKKYGALMDAIRDL